jgi:hypothetical protein
MAVAPDGNGDDNDPVFARNEAIQIQHLWIASGKPSQSRHPQTTNARGEQR